LKGLGIQQGKRSGGRERRREAIKMKERGRKMHTTFFTP
jgi:hypothetical protein